MTRFGVCVSQLRHERAPWQILTANKVIIYVLGEKRARCLQQKCDLSQTSNVFITRIVFITLQNQIILCLIWSTQHIKAILFPFILWSVPKQLEALLMKFLRPIICHTRIECQHQHPSPTCHEKVVIRVQPLPVSIKVASFFVAQFGTQT